MFMCWANSPINTGSPQTVQHCNQLLIRAIGGGLSRWTIQGHTALWGVPAHKEVIWCATPWFHHWKSSHIHFNSNYHQFQLLILVTTVLYFQKCPLPFINLKCGEFVCDDIIFYIMLMLHILFFVDNTTRWCRSKPNPILNMHEPHDIHEMTWL